MKYLIIISLFFFLYSCESDDSINSSQSILSGKSETSFNGEDGNEIYNKTLQRNILIEKKTGAICPSCPSTTERVKTFQDENIDRVHVINYHSGSLAQPHYNQPDFRTDDGDIITSNLSSIGFPATGINREFISSYQLLGFSTFYGDKFLNEAKSDSTNFYIDGYTTQQTDSTLQVVYEIYSKEDLDGNEGWRYYVFLKEDNIIAKQSGATDNYNHVDVFRKSITSALGTPINSSLQGNIFHRYNTTIDINSDWNLEELEILIFITNSDKTVEHVIEFEVI